MNEARIFIDNDITIVKASDVLSGVVSKENEFINLEYEFRVIFVKSAKNHGSPYFRLYLSREDYKKFTPEQKSRYDILCDMMHLKESPWHREWKEKLNTFCSIEKTIRNTATNQCKRADAFCEESNTCVELQHSFIDNDFEERNHFYSKLGINIIWLYDLTKSNIKRVNEKQYEILENNSKGFFKISENESNLHDYKVFIQSKDRLIYQIQRLERKIIDGVYKSTIRLFSPVEIFNENEFFEYIKKFENDTNDDGKPCSIEELWKPNFSCMVVENVLTGKQLLIRGKRDGTIYRNFQYDCILYKYVNFVKLTYKINGNNEYPLSREEEKSKKWILLKGYFRYPYESPE